jgi:L-lactate dehydrogenase complex protein LldG
MDTQKAFLANIRKAVGGSADLPNADILPESLYHQQDADQQQRKRAARSAEDLSALAKIFSENAQPLNLDTHFVNSLDAAANVIYDIVNSTEPEFHNEKQLILHDHPDLVAMRLTEKFAGRNIGVHITRLDDAQVREKTLSSFVGITVPDLAIADGAAVVQLTAPGRPRSTSLIPSIHIAVVHLAKLVADISEAYTWLVAQPSLPDSLVFISGPSKTADIEGQLVHGAHGPRAMHVILIT